MTLFFRLPSIIGIGLLTSIAACQPPPQAPAVAQRTKQVVATVESADMTTRQVTLRAADGTTGIFVAGPEVRNLAQVQAGDKVTITYQEAVAVQMAPAGTTAPAAAITTVDRAALGQMPGAAVSNVLAGRVTIVSVTPTGNSVTFIGQDGATHTAEVRDPKMQAFVQQLRHGDQVDVGYSSEVAVRVDRMN